MDYVEYIDYVREPAPRRRRVQADEDDPFEVLTDEEFEERYRLSKGNVRELIRIITPGLEPVDPRATHGVPHWKQVLIALRFFTSGSYHRETGDLLGVSKSKACYYVHKIASVICTRMRAHFIRFPTGEYATNTKQKFFEKYNFPGVLSIVDGTHVPILCPSTPDKEEYRNRKGYFSINVMATTGANLEFTNIVARWKGSTHDSRVLKNSRLYARFERGNMDGLLIGDSGYECNRFLMTPLANPTTPAQRRFQRSLKSARSSLERMFGTWKTRFRCVHTENMLRFNPRRCCTIIIACAILHNFGIHQRQWFDDLPDAEEENDSGDEDDPRHELEEGVRTRNDIIIHHFTN